MKSPENNLIYILANNLKKFRTVGKPRFKEFFFKPLKNHNYTHQGILYYLYYPNYLSISRFRMEMDTCTILRESVKIFKYTVDMTAI